MFRLSLVPHFIEKKFRFWLIILQIKTKHYVKFLVKRYPFFILDFGLKRQKKSLKALTHPHEKFGILDGTKHTHENFGILYFIILK
jgi:hypothetical protein